MKGGIAMSTELDTNSIQSAARHALRRSTSYSFREGALSEDAADAIAAAIASAFEEYEKQKNNS